nr:MAG TPA: Head to tail joining protein [Caudoviricetes sp.]
MTCTNYTLDMLREAEDAYTRITMGLNVIIVIDQNGERVEYQKANLSALAELIRKMKLELAACGLLGNAHSQQPFRVYF